MNTFREALIQSIDKNGWSQSELARRSGVERSRICRYLGGKSGNISAETTQKLAESAGIEIVYRVKTKRNA